MHEMSRESSSTGLLFRSAAGEEESLDSCSAAADGEQLGANRDPLVLNMLYKRQHYRNRARRELDEWGVRQTGAPACPNTAEAGTAHGRTDMGTDCTYSNRIRMTNHLSLPG